MAAKDHMISLLLVSLLLLSTNAIINDKITRTVQLASGNLLQTINIEYVNDEDKDINEYVLLVQRDHERNLVNIEASFKELSLDIKRDDDHSFSSDKYVPYIVSFGKLQPHGESHMKVREVYANRMVPFPSTMKLLDSPTVRVTEDAYFPTPYKTKKMKSVFECTDGSAIKATEIESGEVRGKNVRYGSYKNVEAFASHPIFIQFSVDSPSPIFTKASREVTISHWSSISIEEEYKLTNRLPKLSNGFGRVDYNPYNIKYALTNLAVKLPVEATDLYYVDEIGNITTSRAYREEDKVDFNIEPRFPILGGWETYWKQGYNLPTKSYVRETENQNEYEVKIGFSHPFEGIVAEEFEFSIILPEGAKDLKFDIPFEMEDIKQETVYKYLDLQGRKKISLTKKNIIEAIHDRSIQITYTLPQFDHYMKPALLVFYLFVLIFVLCQLWRCSSDSESKVKKA